MRTLIASALLLPAACGHDSTAPGGTLQLDAAQAVTARIGSAGELRAHRSRSLDFARDDSGVRRRTRAPSWLRIDPTYATLRGDPRFEWVTSGS